MDENSVIPIAYAESHTIVRKGVISLLQRFQDINVEIEASNGEELIQKIKQSKILPQICILDINMPVMNGFETTIEIKKRWPGIKILVLTSLGTDGHILKMIKEGASGYLLKTCNPEDLRNALLSINKDEIYFSENFTRNIIRAIQKRNFPYLNITPRELQVLKLCCGDLSYGEMAKELKTTKKSIEGNRDRLFRKFNVNSRVSLAIQAIKLGIIIL